MIIITVVAFTSSLFAYHEFSHDTGVVLFNKCIHFSTRTPPCTQSPVPFPIQAKQPVSQTASQPKSYTSLNLCCVNNQNLCSFVANSLQKLNFCVSAFRHILFLCAIAHTLQNIYTHTRISSWHAIQLRKAHTPFHIQIIYIHSLKHLHKHT